MLTKFTIYDKEIRNLSTVRKRILNVTTTSLRFNAEIVVERKEDRCVAHTKPFGVIVYADTEEKAFERAKVAFDLIFDVFLNSPNGVVGLRDYLDRHGVPSYLDEATTPKPEVYLSAVTVPFEFSGRSAADARVPA